MQAIILALVAWFGWGTGDIFGAIVSRKIGGYSSTFWLYFISFLLMSLYAPFALPQLAHLTTETALILLVLSIMGPIPTIALYEGMRVGNVSLVGTIAASFSAITVILSIIFLGDRINIHQSFSIIIIFIGLLLSSLDLRSVRGKQLFSDKGVPYGVIAMILWGISFTFITIPIRQIGWFWPSYLPLFAFPLIYVFMKIRNIRLKLPHKTKTLTPAILNALILSGAVFAYNLAIMNGKTIIVVPIASSYPVLFVLIAYVVFKDQLKKQQVAGIVTTLLGIVFLSVFSLR